VNLCEQFFVNFYSKTGCFRYNWEVGMDKTLNDIYFILFLDNARPLYLLTKGG